MRIEKFVSFLGPVRTGHTLVASLLSAHENISISIELNPIRKMSKKNVETEKIFELILTNCKNRSSVNRGGYDYTLKNDLQNRIENTQIIGDSIAGFKHMTCLSKDNRAYKFYRKLNVPIRWIWVIRDPFNNVHSMNTMSKLGIGKCTSIFMETINMTRNLCELDFIKNNLFIIYLEDLIEDPKYWFGLLLDFLGANRSEYFLDICEEQVFPKSHMVFDQKIWKKRYTNKLISFIENTPELQRYRGDY